jgi:hypothetical protein
MKIPLRNLGQLLARCWVAAEQATATAIAAKHPDPREVNITFLFAGELRAAVAEASDKKLFERAFLADLRARFPELANADLSGTRGLIARVSFHNQHHEGRRSASDLGVIITAPSVRRPAAAPRLEILRDQSSALLAQAKVGRPSPSRESRLRWGRLTDTQERLIPDHGDYYALLLYRLEGAAKNELAPFRWQPCRRYSVPDIKSWLRSGNFPSELSSTQVIDALSSGTLGTDSPAVIERIIDPSSSRHTSIEMHVFWPDGTGPDPLFTMHRNLEQRQRQVVIVQRSAP